MNVAIDLKEDDPCKSFTQSYFCKHEAPEAFTPALWGNSNDPNELQIVLKLGASSPWASTKAMQAHSYEIAHHAASGPHAALITDSAASDATNKKPALLNLKRGNKCAAPTTRCLRAIQVKLHLKSATN